MSTKEVDLLDSNTNDDAQAFKWKKSDTTWMLSMYGTAVGAGTLFLPINAGMHGIWPLLILSFLAFPMTFYSHRALCRFVLSGKDKYGDITAVVNEHFGKRAGRFLTFLYFLAIFPIVLMYSVGITNTAQSFIQNQLHLGLANRAVLSLILISLLMSIIRLGQKTIIQVMSFLVYPFIVVLMAMALYLIPHWNSAVFHASLGGSGAATGLLHSLYLGIPVVVFSFNHSAIISSFAVNQRNIYGDNADPHCSRVLKSSHVLMVVSVLFFVFSCVLSLSPADLMLAKKQNISILSYLANHFHTPFISYLAPVVAFVAIAKSFLGHYLGASEGLRGLIASQLAQRNIKINRNVLATVSDLFIVLTCWLVATINPSILGMIESLGGPITAVILFLLPIYGIKHIPSMKKYEHKLSDGFIFVIGLIALSVSLHHFF